MPTFIYDAVRTPRGKGVPATDGVAGGGLSELAPQELISQLVGALAQRSKSDLRDQIGMMMLSCVGQVGSQGGHISLVSKLASGINQNSAAITLNNYCAGGLSAVNLGAAWTKSQSDKFVLAGGVEMLSQVPFLADKANFYTDAKTREKLGWLPAPMGSELVAALEGYSRNDLDEVVLRSHQRAAKAQANGNFDRSLITVQAKDGGVALDKDEWVRPSLTIEKLARLPELFPDATMNRLSEGKMKERFPDLESVQFNHSPGHVPGYSDGAALALLGDRDVGLKTGVKPIAEIVAQAEVGGDSILQFGAGFDAMEEVLSKAGMSLSDLDLIEFMEAFAAPPLRFERVYKPDMDKVNVNGGHLAMGHPMGATGAVLLSILLDELIRRNQETGMVVTLGATGVGSALIIRRV